MVENTRRRLVVDSSDEDEANENNIPYLARPGDVRDDRTKKGTHGINLKYSLDKFRSLLDYFRNVQVLTPDSPPYVVEKVRNLAEFLVYGQEYGRSAYFEEFIEENVCQGHLSRFLAFNNRLIHIQLIQTMSILVQNIKEKSHLFYLLGNPFLNHLITYEFRFA